MRSFVNASRSAGLGNTTSLSRKNRTDDIQMETANLRPGASETPTLETHAAPPCSTVAQTSPAFPRNPPLLLEAR